jgi:hypothetical protein
MKKAEYPAATEKRMSASSEICEAYEGCRPVLPHVEDRDKMTLRGVSELYLGYGVTTCPDINNSSTEWISAQCDGVQKGKLRGPSRWISGQALDRPQGVLEQRSSIHGR